MNDHRSRRSTVGFLAAAGVCGGMTPLAFFGEDQCNSSSDRIAWVVESLKRMQTIKPGMTRNQLLKVFTTEGGISTARERLYVSRDCPYFKVKVDFRQAIESEQTDWLQELDGDVITAISDPFLQFGIMD